MMLGKFDLKVWIVCALAVVAVFSMARKVMRLKCGLVPAQCGLVSSVMLAPGVAATMR